MLANVQKSTVQLEIERMGYTWVEDSQYDLSLLSTDRRVQVRESEHYSPKAQVDQYAVQMKEVKFPPIVITRNNVVVDGNTRLGAQHKNKLKLGAVIIIDVEYGKNAKDDNQLHALAATFNQIGGQRLTPSESREAAKPMIALGWKAERIARALGVPASGVNAIRREIDARAKFAKVMFTEGDKLPVNIQRIFGSQEVTVINDIPYKGLVQLTLDAGLAGAEVRELVKEMKAIGSDSGAMEHIAAKRAEWEDRIREKLVTGSGHPAASGILRRNFGFARKYKDNPSVLVERVPAVMMNHLEVCRDVLCILQAVIDEQVDILP